MPTLHIDGDDLKKLLDGETVQHPVTGLRVELDREATGLRFIPTDEKDCRAIVNALQWYRDILDNQRNPADEQERQTVIDLLARTAAPETERPGGELAYDNPLPPPETIDLTPRGMATPEGCARTSAALEAWNASAHTVANLAANLLAARQNGTVTAYDWEELEQAIQLRAAKQEEFLRAVAGVPPAK